MSSPKIAIFGASGFVGSALCERLYFQDGVCFRPLIHSFGNAARVARFPVEPKSVDVLDYDQIREGLAGCDAVVNCVLGGKQVMTRGLKNVIRAAKENKIKRFVHISSIAICGEDPPPESESEPQNPQPSNDYGRLKKRQDELVFKLHDDGVPSIILCPGHILGPYSPFIVGVIEKLLAREILLVDGGGNPTNHVHVDNLVHAILTALKSRVGWGERYFVTEVERPSWKDFYEDMKEILGLEYQFESVSRNDVMEAFYNDVDKHRFSDNFRLLLSGEIRRSLSVIPAFRRLNQWAYNMFTGMRPEFQRKLRRMLERPLVIRKETGRPDLNQRFIRLQVRQVHHSPKKIMGRLGYRPMLNYKEGTETIRSWCRFANAI